MPVPRVSLVLTNLVGVGALCLCVVMLTISIPRGLNLADEGLYVYLLTHPATPMPFMDAFVWGKITAVLHLNLIAVRWMTLVVLMGSAGVLCIAVIHFIQRSHPVAEQPHLLRTLVSVLTSLGVLLFYVGDRPTLSYAFSTAVALNIFAAAMFTARSSRRRPPLAADLVAGVAVALTFMARPPTAALLVIWQIVFSLILDDEAARKEILWRSLVTTIASAGVFIGIAVLFGYDIRSQVMFIGALTVTSHSFHDLVRIDAPYGVAILLIAVCGALVFSAIHQNDRRRAGQVLVTAVGLSAMAALVQLWLAGDFQVAVPEPNIFFGNPPLKSWGPAIHSAALCLLLVAAMPMFSSRLRRLHRLAGSGGDELSDAVARIAVLLYLLCPMSQFGTNAGLWHRSIADMGPLFLAVALVIWDACRKGLLSPRQMPALVFCVALPIVADVYANQIARPPGLNGSIWNQSAVLQHPAFLFGLRVPKRVLERRNDIERDLRAAGFDPRKDILLAGEERIGLVDLVGGTSLGSGWYFTTYGGSQVWNCMNISLGLGQPHGRIFAVDAESLLRRLRQCPAGLRAGKRTGTWVLELTTRSNTDNGRE